MFIKPETKYCWNLKLKFSLGFIPDFDESGRTTQFTWIDLENKTFHQGKLKQLELCHNGIELCVTINGEPIIHRPVSEINNREISSVIDDSSDNQTKTLLFTFSGFEETHMPLVDENTSARAAIKLSLLEFEDVDVFKLFDSSSINNTGDVKSRGGIMFSSNGTSSFEFSTPIYRWLLDNQLQLLR